MTESKNKKNIKQVSDREYIEGESPETIQEISSQKEITDKAQRKPTRAPSKRDPNQRKNRKRAA